MKFLEPHKNRIMLLISLILLISFYHQCNRIKSLEETNAATLTSWNNDKIMADSVKLIKKDLTKVVYERELMKSDKTELKRLLEKSEKEGDMERALWLKELSKMKGLIASVKTDLEIIKKDTAKDIANIGTISNDSICYPKTKILTFSKDTGDFRWSTKTYLANGIQDLTWSYKVNLRNDIIETHDSYKVTITSTDPNLVLKNTDGIIIPKPKVSRFERFMLDNKWFVLGGVALTGGYIGYKISK